MTMLAAALVLSSPVTGGGAAGTAIILVGRTIAEDAIVGDDIGTFGILGSYTGSPTFTLDADAGGLFALDGAILEVASALTVGEHTITVSVAGITPDATTRDFTIEVTEVVAGVDVILMTDGSSSILMTDGTSEILLAA